MTNKIIFKKIKFINIDTKNFDKCISNKGLFVFPAGPALASIQKSNQYYKSIKKADLVFFDSGFFVLLLKIFKNINVKKFSGYKFLGLFFDYLKLIHLNHDIFLDNYLKYCVVVRYFDLVFFLPS